MNLTGVFLLLEAGAALGAMARLIFLGLASNVPALLVWLTVLASNLFFAFVPEQAALYFFSYLIYVALYCVASIFAVREMFALVFARYAGIRSAGRWGMYAGMTLAIAVSLVLTRVFQHSGEHGDRVLLYTELAQRSIIVSLAIVIVTILFFLSRYPLHLGRNAYVSSALFSVLFLSDAARLLIDSLAPLLYNHFVDRAESVFTFVVLLVSVFLLVPHEEINPGDDGVTTAHEDDLLAQLSSLNDLLSRAARRQ